MSDKITMKEMCETIIKADIIAAADGGEITAEDIFNYSPIGELFMVFQWYEIAKNKLAEAV